MKILCSLRKAKAKPDQISIPTTVATQLLLVGTQPEAGILIPPKASGPLKEYQKYIDLQ